MQDICIPEGIGGSVEKEAPGTFGENVPGAEATCCYLTTILVVGQQQADEFLQPQGGHALFFVGGDAAGQDGQQLQGFESGHASPPSFCCLNKATCAK